MLIYFFIRLIIGIAALSILGFYQMNNDVGGGNNGMGLKSWLYVALAILVIEALYLFVEMLILAYKSNFRFAAINLVLLVIGIFVFLFLASR